MMSLADFGFSSRKLRNSLVTAEATSAVTSPETSLSLICELNLGSGCLTETMAKRPSRMSSPWTHVIDCPVVYDELDRATARR